MNAQIKSKLKTPPPSEVKAAAKAMIDHLPSRVLTWERLAYHVGVRAAIEHGLAEADATLLIPHEEIEKRIGLEHRYLVALRFPNVPFAGLTKRWSRLNCGLRIPSLAT